MVGSDKLITLEQVLARTGDSALIAVTAPLILESAVLIGIADAETSSCLAACRGTPLLLDGRGTACH
jgi:hypothetical protein